MDAKTKKKYLKSPFFCPECGSDQIEGRGGFDFEGDSVFQDVDCLKCGATWSDQYKIFDVVVKDDGKGNEEVDCPRCEGTREEPGAPVEKDGSVALCGTCGGTGTVKRKKEKSRGR